jgi:regulation of enolase protein 1 (concanavalin A-like superfamily)
MSRRPLALLAVAVIVPLLAADKDTKPRKIEGWGEVVDPDGDCKFTVEATKGILVVNVPGTLHDLAAETGDMTAPRILSDIEGDFVATVKIGGKVSHKGGLASKRFAPYHGAGLLVWVDEANYIRLERAYLPEPPGRQGPGTHYYNFEIRERGTRTQGAGLRGPDRPTYLRLERRGGRFLGSVSPNGKDWEEFQPQIRADLPARVRVGVVAVNSSTERFAATFEGLKVRKGGGK